MRTLLLLVFVFALTLIHAHGTDWPAPAILGDAPVAPADLSGLPGGGPRPKLASGTLTVDTTSREQVREFYNAVYSSSTGVPMNSTAQTASCVPGTNSPAFVNATLLRLNWFRALAGIPATVSFNATECTEDQAAAVMMSEHGALQHVGSWTGWDCVSSYGTNAAGNSNLALGNDGPDAIVAYMLDNGANNYEVGHRRWVLYPQTQIMATGDVPAQSGYYSANALWVFDANYGGPRPATRKPFVCWPPAGYVPYQVAYPQWSFALSNANLSAATVTMASNGVPVAVSLQSYVAGYGENTLVWYLSSQNPSTDTAFPFGGTDTVYSVTISNVVTAAGTASFAYNVTLFDPATAGADYTPLVISGPSQPYVNQGNPYVCTPSANPAATGYQWLMAEATNGNLVDSALNGLTNFTMSPTPTYSVTTTPPVGTGKCFHLCHTNPVPQLLQLNELLFPSNSAVLSFKSLLGYATAEEVARVQISTDQGISWQDIYTQAGTGGSGQSSFTTLSFPLTNYLSQRLLVRFDYDFSSGTYYPQASANVGWCLENITITNCQQLIAQTTNVTASTNFVFTPAQAGNYLLQARGVIFNAYATDAGTAKAVAAVAGGPVISVNALQFAGSQVKIAFSLSGTVAGFHLLQTDRLGSAWTTNTSATLSTNVPGSSFQFAVPNSGSPAMRFYRVMSP